MEMVGEVILTLMERLRFLSIAFSIICLNVSHDLLPNFATFLKSSWLMANVSFHYFHIYYIVCNIESLGFLIDVQR